VSDIDTALMDGLKVLDPEGPIREADILTLQPSGQSSPGRHVDGDAENTSQASVVQLPSSREPPAVATVVAQQASNAATRPGLDVANRRGISRFSRQRAQTHSPTRTSWIAGKPKCFLAGTEIEPGGIATACRLAGNFGSPKSSDAGSALESRLNSGQLNLVCHLSSDSRIEMRLPLAPDSGHFHTAQQLERG
jgi:hypothetical protein